MAVQYTILQCDLNYLISILGKWQQEHAILLIKTLSNRFQNRQALIWVNKTIIQMMLMSHQDLL